MFATMSPQRPTATAFVLAAALLGARAVFAQPSPVTIHWSPQQTLDTAFALEMVLARDGRLQGAIVPREPHTRVAGTHSALGATADGRSATFGTLWQRQRPDGVLERLGELTVQVQAADCPPGGCKGGGDIVVFDILGVTAQDAAVPGCQGEGCKGGGDIVVFDILGVTSTASSLRIEAQPGQHLQGSPAHWFNRPGPGEPLIATFPALESGESLDVILEVHDANDPSATPTRIPVTVKHGL